MYINVRIYTGTYLNETFNEFSHIKYGFRLDINVNLSVNFNLFPNILPITCISFDKNKYID